MDLTAFF